MAKAAADYLTELCDVGVGAGDAYWELIDAFVADIGLDRALAAAREWCGRADPDVHSVGLDVLGIVARVNADLVEELLDHARSAQSGNDDVRWSAAVALQRLDDDRARDLLVPFLADSDSAVRYQAVKGLSSPTDQDLPEGHPVVRGLLAAMEDRDADVRDWATFAIGSQFTVDTATVREALVRHLDDDGGDTAGEAAVGLARRHDRRVYPVLTARLADPDVGNLYVEAAGELADARLLPLLRALQTAGWQENDPLPSTLDDAIAACVTGPATTMSSAAEPLA